MSSIVVDSSSSKENPSGAGDEMSISTMMADLNPEPSLSSHAFLAAALSLKDQVVEATWRSGDGAGGAGADPTLFTGLLGTAFTCLRSYEATGNPVDLALCSDVVDACAAAAATRAPSRHVTFLCGRGGIYAIGAVAANYKGDHQRRDYFLHMFIQMAQEPALPIGPEEGGFGMSYELMYGRAGFLWAALFVNKHLGEGTIDDDLVRPVVNAVLAGGRAGASDNPACPLMYRWHGTRYWGAANGLAGILHVLLHFPLDDPRDAEDVKATLRYMMNNRFPRSGNYPSSEGNPRDKFVQWSHGATGMAITLCKASQVFANEREFRDAAIEAGEVVWRSGLVKKVGLADGVAGNAYAFLSLYRLTGERVYEERANAFTGYLYRNVRSELISAGSNKVGHLGHGGWSLFQGLAGIACLWFDVVAPEKARFPGFEL